MDSHGASQVAAFDLVLHSWDYAPNVGDNVIVLEFKRNQRTLRGFVLVNNAADGRVLVQCGYRTVSVPQRRVFPAYSDFTTVSKRPIIVAVPDTDSLRRLVRLQASADDAVIDIGCSYGACSVTHCRSFVGIDISHECIEHCQNTYPQLRYEKIDALGDRAALRGLLLREHPSIIIVDIAGVRPLPDVMEMLEVSVAMMAEVDAATSGAHVLLLKSESLVAAAGAALDGAHAPTRALCPPSPQPPPPGVQPAIALRLSFPSATSVHAAISIAVQQPLLRAIPCGESADDWWSTTLASGAARRKSAGRDTQLHTPKWYPQKRAPGSSTVICKFHNFARHGCRIGSSASGCRFDHEHCHFCLRPGHAATGCAAFLATLAPGMPHY